MFGDKYFVLKAYSDTTVFTDFAKRGRQRFVWE